MDLYLISDRKLFFSEDDFYKAINDALKGGIKMLQMREKDLPDKKLLEMAYKLREITSKYFAKFLINDRIDVAMIVSADGVHLGQSSMYADVIKGICKKDMLVGVSTHSLAEAIDAEKRGADFITFGPVFETASKKIYGEPVGLQNLMMVVDALSIPVFAIGGVKLDNLSEIINIKPKGIALISGILASNDIYETTKRYLQLLGEKR